MSGLLRVFAALWLLGMGVFAQVRTVPVPALDGLETRVVEQINEAAQEARATGDADSVGRLGRIYHAYEFLDAAAAAYGEARRLAPRDYRWVHLLGAVREQTGAFELAVDSYLEALRLEPGDHAAHIRLAAVLLQLDRRGEARSHLELQRDRFPASAMAGLGEIALRERRFADAVRLFEEALRRAPQATNLHYSIGMAYRGLNRLSDAQAHLTRAGQGSVRPADPLVDALPDLLRGYRAPLNQARVELQAGALPAAAAMFRRAIAAAPDDMDERPTIELAIRLADEQRFAEAVALMTDAFRRFPNRDATATTLARLLAASPERSVRNGGRALEIAMKVHARTPAPAHAETVALALVELARCDEAAEWMRRAIAHAEREGDAAEAARLGTGGGCK